MVLAILGSVVEGVGGLARLLWAWAGADDRVEHDRRVEIEDSVAELRRSFDRFSRSGGMAALSQLLQTVDVRAVSSDVVRLVDMLEELLQAAHADVGPARRDTKWRLVKVGVRRIFVARTSPELLSIPLVPVVFELGLDLVVPVLDDWLDDRRLWTVAEPARGGGLGLAVWAGAGPVVSAVGTVAGWLTRLYWTVASTLAPVGPATRAVVAQHSVGADVDERLGAVSRLLGELVRERQLLLAATRVVTAAVIEAERLLHSTGPEKALHARLLLRTVLDEIGGGWAWPVIEPLAMVSIDLAVYFLNKRGVFSHVARSAAQTRDDRAVVIA